MTIFDLQNQIEENSIQDFPIIFVETKDNFISRQYIERISQIKKMSITYIDLQDLYSYNDIFNVDNSIRVLKIDKLDINDNIIFNQKNLFIVTNLVDKNTKKIYNDIVIDLPVLTKDNIKEYVYSKLGNLNQKDIDYLLDICNYNINRLQLEIDKILLFKTNEQPNVFQSFKADDIFSDLSSKTIFDIINAISKKDVNKLKDVYKDIDKIDINDMGLLILLINNFTNIIKVQLSTSGYNETMGISEKQYNAIKYSCGRYSKEQLLKIFEFLTSIDKKIKTGEVSMNILRDYMIIKILSM